MASTDIANFLEDGVAGFGTATASAIAPNNTTGVLVKTGPGYLFGISAFNNSSTIAYVKVYDTAIAATSSDTPVLRMLIPGPPAGGGGFISLLSNGRFFANGISYRITTGIADNDTGSPAASTYLINLSYK